ncbi:nucleoside-triphosphatase [Flaviaesturariibacter amylovorans]|uniref:DUF2478 domain-containing protein n=1 Tax=Flaviaesturariibacter amylovorans TaxID=1084520 RepID=A0ABP8GZQ8_9BACT
MNVFLLTGPIESGKTTALATWANDREEVCGILMPGTGADRRFLDIATGASWPASAEPGSAEAFTVGRYSFSIAAFARAENVLLEAVKKAGGWLLIDEIGKLELAGQGFDATLRHLLHAGTQKASPTALVLVVRDSLVDAIQERYGLAAAALRRHPSELPAALPNS